MSESSKNSEFALSLGGSLWEFKHSVLKECSWMLHPDPWLRSSKSSPGDIHWFWLALVSKLPQPLGAQLLCSGTAYQRPPCWSHSILVITPAPRKGCLLMGIRYFWGRSLCSVFLHGGNLAHREMGHLYRLWGYWFRLPEKSQSFGTSTQMSPLHGSQSLGFPS